MYVFTMIVLLPRHPIEVTMHPQDNFSWVPNCSLGPPECETKFTSKHFGMDYVKMHGFHGNPYMIFENGVRPTNSIISRVLLILGL